MTSPTQPTGPPEGVFASYHGQPAGYYPPDVMPGGTPAPPPPRPNSGLAVASLILGLTGVVVSWFTFGIPSLLALIFGIVGIRQTTNRQREGRGMAIAGTVLGAVMLALGLWVSAAVVYGIGSAVDAVNKPAPIPSSIDDGELGLGTPDSVQETTPAPADTAPTGPAAIGSKSSFEWTDGLEVWVTSAKRVVSKPDQYTETERFVGVTVKVKNGTSGQVDLSSFSVVLRYGAAGSEAENEYVSTEGYDGLNGRVAPGKIVSGSFAFKVPGRAVPIAIEINPGYDSEYNGYDSAFFEGKV